MFVHGRESTTCSLYIQGNASAGYNDKSPAFGRPGDSRFVFGLFKAESKPAQLAILGMYPYWDPKFGPATPTTYAVAWHNVTLANVDTLNEVRRGFSLADDKAFMTMAAAIPRSAVPWLPQFER